MSPADATFSLLSCPHPPNPRSQSALPDRKGEIFVILLQGASPLASPGAGGTRHWFGGRWRRPAGACPVGRRFYLPFRHPAGGLPSLSPVYPAFCLLSCPHPPTRAHRALFPAGRGSFLLSYARGFAPCIPGAGGVRHWLGFEETIRFGIAGGRRLQLQSITNSRKVLGGLGASFKKPPNVFPPLASPGQAGRGTGSVLRKQFGLVSPEDAGYSYSQ